MIVGAAVDVLTLKRLPYLAVSCILLTANREKNRKKGFACMGVRWNTKAQWWINLLNCFFLSNYVMFKMIMDVFKI